MLQHVQRISKCVIDEVENKACVAEGIIAKRSKRSRAANAIDEWNIEFPNVPNSYEYPACIFTCEEQALEVLAKLKQIATC